MVEIRDFMIRDVVTVRKESTIRHLLKTLVSNKIGGVPVVDEEQKLIGMVSDGDVLRALTPREQTIFDFYTITYVLEKQELDDNFRSTLRAPVERIMTKRNLYYVYPDDEFRKVLKILARHRFKKIPVINRAERVIGVISRGDVLRYISTQLLEEE
ncbi:MAG TPA: CBS domain-containing protein [Bacillales bacterium]|nr:CBS domain-containing protein [Bacillales bacterium]